MEISFATIVNKLFSISDLFFRSMPTAYNVRKPRMMKWGQGVRR